MVSLEDDLSEILATSRGRAREHALNALCRRACAFLLVAEVSWVRRHEASEANAADFDSRLADLGQITPSEVLGASKNPQRFAAHNVWDHHHFVRATWPALDCICAHHCGTEHTDTAVSRTDSQSRLHHRVKLVTTSELSCLWSLVESR